MAAYGLRLQLRRANYTGPRQRCGDSRAGRIDYWVHGAKFVCR
jgi:hypothetical protein